MTATTLEAKWIPVRPGTDTAFLLGVAYEMLRLDEEEGGIVDWDFLERYTVGFDEEHLPEGASTTENIRGYLLGKYDGTPKTAEWASEICGADPEDITWLARVMGKDNAVSWLFGYAPSRCNGAENLPQIMEAAISGAIAPTTTAPPQRRGAWAATTASPAIPARRSTTSSPATTAPTSSSWATATPRARCRSSPTTPWTT